MMHIGKLFPLSFAAGNIGRVDFITENEYDLFVRPDTCNPRVRKVIQQTRLPLANFHFPKKVGV